MTNPTPMTDEQCVLAMWKLMSPNYSGLCLDDGWRIFPDYTKGKDEVLWVCEPMAHLQDGNFVPVTVRKSIAHRAILDAAREVLDDAEVYISKSPSYLRQWIFWMDRIYPSDPVASRTQCTYHALAWLKGKSE